MRHLMSPLDFSTQELDELFDLAAAIEADLRPGHSECLSHGKTDPVSGTGNESNLALK